eukprot:372275_1
MSNKPHVIDTAKTRQLASDFITYPYNNTKDMKWITEEILKILWDNYASCISIRQFQTVIKNVIESKSCQDTQFAVFDYSIASTSIAKQLKILRNDETRRKIGADADKDEKTWEQFFEDVAELVANANAKILIILAYWTGKIRQSDKDYHCRPLIWLIHLRG